MGANGLSGLDIDADHRRWDLALLDLSLNSFVCSLEGSMTQRDEPEVERKLMRTSAIDAKIDGGRPFEGSVAVITGGGRGLGKSHALLLGKLGAKIVVNDTGIDKVGVCTANRTCQEIKAAGGVAVANSNDISCVGGASGLIDQAVQEFGRIDVLINNAGVLQDSRFENMTVEVWRQVLSVNLDGSFYVSQPTWKIMKAQGTGRIVFTTSSSGVFGNTGHVNYGAAKMAIYGMTKALALEGVEHGIVVNAIAPFALTPMSMSTSGVRTSASDVMGNLFERMSASDVSPLVALLAHSSCPVTGQLFSVGGGRCARIVVAESQGWKGNHPSVGVLRNHWDEICALDELHFPGSMTEELLLFADAFEGERVSDGCDGVGP